MTAILVFLALVIATGLGVWLLSRSSTEPPGASGVDPDATDHEPEQPRER